MGLAFVIFGLYIGQEHRLSVFTKRLYLIAYFALIVPITVILVRYIVSTLLSGALDDPILDVALLLLIPVTVDYRVHDIWNNTNKSWTKNIEEIGFPLTNLSDRLTLNEDSFSITNRSEYVKLSLDLEALGFPDHYSVIFYVGNSSQNKMDHKFTNRAQHTIVDFLDRIFVLLPQYSLITNPSTIELRQGDDRKFKCS